MLPKTYDPKTAEDRIYRMWEESCAFVADVKSAKEPFTISLPPPNATGQLHVGNAMMIALEDVFIRFQRMRGKEALWVPGTDHAAIATESFVIRKLQKEQKMRDPRKELGREKLLKGIHAFVENSKKTIRGQIRKMGASCDWSREHYTMEPALNRIVVEVFVKMYRDGLIYRGNRIVNWDPALQTTVSDDEIIYEERKEPFYTFKYGPFEISTSRPETKFGDKYVVMHPDDMRYAKYTHGEKMTVEWINGPVETTVIKDKAVDPEFGTGVMTITPWHDHADFEIAERHKLDKEQIIGFDGKLLPIAGEFSGLTLKDARPKIVEKLKAKGLLVGVKEDYLHNVALSQRGKGMIEPQIKEQWFIDVNKRVVKWKRRELSLKEVMQEVVQTGLIKIIPNRFEKTYFHWIDNLRDWCISRQIWWGHRIPVWYRNAAGASDIHVGVQPPKGTAWEQDSDTLDTWFSSALWTWSTLVDRSLAGDFDLTLEDILLKSPDFLKFHPTDVLETGYDILFFWVARMILMTTYVTGAMPELEYGQAPFDVVYLHGLIRDREGRKMSKTHPETNIDPIDVIGKYGADALRLAMIVGQSPGNDFRLYEEKIAGYRNFVNKLWNASRFVLMKCEEEKKDPSKIASLPPVNELTLADRALLHALQALIHDVASGLQQYRLSEVGERLYAFVWDYFCDWYLELSKGTVNLDVLVHALRTIIKLLHPYCPFVTEELWASLKPADAGMLIREQWPTITSELQDQQSFDQLLTLINVITAIRKLRSEQRIAPGKQLTVTIFSKEHAQLLDSQSGHIRRLAKVGSLTIAAHPQELKSTVAVILAGAEVHLSLAGLINKDAELKKLAKEGDELRRYISGIEAKLRDRSFTDKAPPKVVEAERRKLEETSAKLKTICERIRSLA
ncbi:valine--tRNA ligase [Candidatus Peregrinibacteria bacterium]|nr:valine--tRNA ligase [Candidatus Peregrinibacteria bacterium]